MSSACACVNNGSDQVGIVARGQAVPVGRKHPSAVCVHGQPAYKAVSILSSDLLRLGLHRLGLQF